MQFCNPLSVKSILPFLELLLAFVLFLLLPRDICLTLIQLRCSFISRVCAAVAVSIPVDGIKALAKTHEYPSEGCFHSRKKETVETNTTRPLTK